MLALLQEIDACRGFTQLGYPSLFRYVNEELRLSEACTYRLIAVSRKAPSVPELMEAVRSDRISVTVAAVIVPVITAENQRSWIAKAEKLSKRDLEREVAEARPEDPRPERAKHQGNKMVRIEVTVPEETWALLERAKALLAQKESRRMDLASALHAIAAAYVKRNDPVAKADRNAQSTPPGGSSQANIRHTVHARDRGACQYKMPNGKICGERKWIHVHHIRPKSEGGEDRPENLTTLCSAHHRLVHESHLH